MENYFDALVRDRVDAIRQFRTERTRLPLDELELARFVGDDHAVEMMTAKLSGYDSGDPDQDQADSSSNIQWCMTERKLFLAALSHFTETTAR